MGDSKENIFILNATNQQSDFKTYSNPIPSREFIMNTVAKVRKNLNREQIANELGLDNPEQKEGLSLLYYLLYYTYYKVQLLN